MHKFESSLLDCYQKYSSNLDDVNEPSPDELANPLFIAFSGGLDSTVLLFASNQLHNKQLMPKSRALHVNHGIESESYNWQTHCRLICEQYSIELNSKELKLSSISDKTSENSARNARYKFFESQLNHNSLIAFAHHKDDQVETLLFRLFRGTGISGAGAIPESRKLGDGKIIRPFLNISKDELLYYAEKNKLKWIEDPSNFENRYSRNIIRNSILPLIKQSWPKASDTLSRFTQIAREQNGILLEVANNDLLMVSSDVFSLDNPSLGNHSSDNVTSKNISQIDLDLFNKLSKVRQKNLLHYWIVNNPKNNYSKATNYEIEELLHQLEKYFSEIEYLTTSKLNVKLGNCRVRFFDDKLWLCEHSEPEALIENIRWDDVFKPVNVFCNQEIIATNIEFSTDERLIRLPKASEIVTIRPRIGGEKIKPQYRDKSCKLKKVYQELSIPHWKREWLPIIYYNDQIACVPGVFINKEFMAKSTDVAIKFSLNKNK